MLDAGVPWGYSLQNRGILLTVIQGLAWLMFLALWVRIFRSDSKEKKIRHEDLLYGGAFALLCYAVMLGGTILGRLGYVGLYYRPEFYGDLLSHAVLAAAAAMVMWRLRIWPAGDAKLFMLLSLVYPLMPTGAPFQSGWLFLALLINVFLPASVAVFLLALRHVWRRQLTHYAGFFLQLARRGWRVALDYLLDAAGRGARLTADSLAGAVAAVLKEPRQALVQIGSWVSSMFAMAMLTSALRDYLPSALGRTLFSFALLFGMNWARGAVGALFPWLFYGGLAAAAWSGALPVRWEDVWRSFSYLSVFSFFLFLGIRSTMGALSGPVMMFAFPLLGALLGGLIGAASSLVTHGWNGALGLAHSPWARTLLGLAALGTFFGLSFVFVRMWDDEEHPDIPRENLLPYMVLHYSMVDRLRQDEDFYAAHFESALYADGLTPSQADALRGWCERNQVQTVPLTHTMPFAHWIFVGFFITWLINGHVLRLAP